eukprot:s5210_g6.t1
MEAACSQSLVADEREQRQRKAEVKAAEKEKKREEKERRRREKEEKRRRQAAEQERINEEERLRQEAAEAERQRLEAEEEARLKRQVEEEEEQLRREAEEEEERLRKEAEEEEERLRQEQLEMEELQRREEEELRQLERREAEEAQRRRRAAEEAEQRMWEAEERRRREAEEEERLRREAEEQEERMRAEAEEEERLRREAEEEEERLRQEALEEEEEMGAPPTRSVVGNWLKSSSARGNSWPRKLLQRTRTGGLAGSTTDATIDPEALIVTRQHGGERSRDAVLPEVVCGARTDRRCTAELLGGADRAASASTRRSDVNRFPDLGAAITMHGLVEADARRARDPRRTSREQRRTEAYSNGTPAVHQPDQASSFLVPPPVEALSHPDHDAEGVQAKPAPAAVPGLTGFAGECLPRPPVDPPPPDPPPQSATDSQGHPVHKAFEPALADLAEPLAEPRPLAAPQVKAAPRGAFTMAWGAAPTRKASPAVPAPVNLYQQQFAHWQQQQQLVQEQHRRDLERQKREEEELKQELQQQLLQQQAKEEAAAAAAREAEERRAAKAAEAERAAVEAALAAKEEEERRERERQEAEERAKQAERQRILQMLVHFGLLWKCVLSLLAPKEAAGQEEASRAQVAHASADQLTAHFWGLPAQPVSTTPVFPQSRMQHYLDQQVQPQHAAAPSPQHLSPHLLQAAPGQHPAGGPVQPAEQEHAPTEESDYDPFASANAAQAAHSAKNEKEYNPFEQAERDAAAAEDLKPSSADLRIRSTEGRPQLLMNTTCDLSCSSGATRMTRRTREPLNPSLKLGQRLNRNGQKRTTKLPKEMLRAAEREGGSASSRSVDPAPAPQAAQQSRPMDTGEEHFAKAKAKPKTEYHFNCATQRWEPKAAPPSPPKPEPFRPGALAQIRPNMTGPAVPRQRPQYQQQVVPPRPMAPQATHAPPRRLVIAECEAEARADAASGSCSLAQALAVRLALRFESRPKDILVSMSEAGLPAAKDQRSTVKTIMRLCHPDKCKHPEAKRAMQILGPLLS